MYLKFVRKCHTIIFSCHKHCLNADLLISKDFVQNAKHCNLCDISGFYCYTRMATRSHHSVPKRGYHELTDVTVPKRSIVSRPLSFTKSNGRSEDSSSYRLNFTV